MNEILAAATIIGAVVAGVTQMVKQTDINNKWLPFINVGIGIILGVLYATTIVGGDLAIYAWAGAISGMAAGGFYDTVTNGKAIYDESDAKTLTEEGKGEQL